MAAMPRFVPLADVAETLSISAAQAYSLVRSGELPAIQVGGRGQWRVELTQLEAYIERKYAETRRQVAGQDAVPDPVTGQASEQVAEGVSGPDADG
jgi:excisionase family DNA binding protein